ncbi:hypothetical protein ACWEPC_00470 [Nonomuraea sp. NPDC004297]
MSLIDEVLQGIEACTAHPAASVNVSIRPYQAHPVDILDGQYLIMLKPELTAALKEPDGARLLSWLLKTLGTQGLRPHAVRAMSGAYLAEHQVVQSAYRRLNEISTDGLSKVAQVAAGRLFDRFPEYAVHRERILGGHQFLNRFPEFTARSLDVLVQNLPSVKLGAGTYAAEVQLDGDRYLLLNAFHPFQLAHFTAQGGAIVLLECLSTHLLSDIRAYAVGAIDPRTAQRGSVRHGLADPDSPWCRRWSMCTSLNAVHVSPSAVEAMFAIQRYFEVGDLGRTVLGARLRAVGADLDQVQTLMDDPEAGGASGSVPLFEITEDMPVEDAAALVLRLLSERDHHG